MTSNTLEIGLTEAAIMQAAMKTFMQNDMKSTDRVVAENVMCKLELAFNGLRIRVDIGEKK